MPRKKKTIDRVDLEIIKLLRENGRMTDVDMAKRIGVSKDTVKRRKERLINSGFIHIKALVNPVKFGYKYSFIMGIKVAPGVDVRELAEKLSEIRLIIFIGLSLGTQYNIIAWARAKDQVELQNLVEDIRKNFREIESIETIIIYDIIKHDYYEIGELD
ncbi:MAG: Lrp/AsnC family transcriptional regulator [Candidatus Njordarchaeia archaeon]